MNIELKRIEKRNRAKDNGWIYSIHEKLCMECAEKKTEYGTKMMTEDRVMYNEHENAALKKHGGTNKTIHNIKKIFNGSVI